MTSQRIVPIVLVLLLLALQAQLWIGRGSLPNVRELQTRIEAQRAKNQQAQLRNDRLQAEVNDLREGLDMVEEAARSKLGMVKPHEIFVQLAPPPPGR